MATVEIVQFVLTTVVAVRMDVPVPASADTPASAPQATLTTRQFRERAVTGGSEVTLPPQPELEVDGSYDRVGVRLSGADAGHVLRLRNAAAHVERLGRGRAPGADTGRRKQVRSGGSPHRGVCARRSRRGRARVIELVRERIGVGPAEHLARAAACVTAKPEADRDAGRILGAG